MQSRVSKLKRFLHGIATFLILTGFTCAGISVAVAQQPAKILHIDSYHPGYQWSEDIRQGIQSRLIAEDIEFDVVHLDYFRTSNALRLQSAIHLAEKRVNTFKPDVIITSNDVAAKYVIEPLLEGHDTPIIFTGVHSDTEKLDFPRERVTGIVEFAMVEQLVDLLEQYSQGRRIGLLSIDTLSGRNIQNQYRNILQSDFDQVYYARDFELWTRYLGYLQDQVDLILLVDPTGLPGWNSSSARSFVQEKIRIPVGATDRWLAPLSLITIAKVPQEQGWWAADIAMKLVQGENPGDFPISRTRDAKLLINFKTAERLNIVFSTELIEIGSKVEN